MDKLCFETCIFNFADIDKFFSWVWRILSFFFFTMDNPSFCPISTRGSIFPNTFRRIPVSMLCLLHGYLKFLPRKYGSFQRVHVRTGGDPEITSQVPSFWYCSFSFSCFILLLTQKTFRKVQKSLKQTSQLKDLMLKSNIFQKVHLFAFSNLLNVKFLTRQ